MKKTISMIITLAMLLTMLPLAAFAQGPTVYCQAPESWTQCYVYTWNGYGEYASWPGEPATMDANGLWVYNMPEGYEVVVFSDGIGAHSNDLYLADANGDYRYIFPQDNWAGSATPTAEYTVVGNADFMGAWDVSSTLGDMDEIDDGVFYALFLDVQPGDYEFKVVGDHSWDHAWGDNGNNYRFSVDRESAVRVYFYEDDQRIHVDLEYNENFYTVVGNADFMGAWDVNSTLGDMEQTGDVLYEKVFYDVQPGDYELKVAANHSWEEAWGAGDANFCFTVTETCDVRVTFERFWDVVRVYLDGQEYIPFNEKTIHLYVPESWSAVYAYTWEPETMGPWPGIQLAKDGDWYTFTVSTEETLLHFHDNVEDGQRETLEMPPWPEIWITVKRFGASYSMYPLEVPDEPPVSPYTYTVVGNADFMGNWNSDSTVGDMTEVYYNWYQLHLPVVQPGDYEFKIVRDHDWDYAWGDENGISNYAFTLEQPAEVVISFDSQEGRIIVDIFDIDEPVEPEYKVVGDADFMGAWDVSSDLGLMTETGDGIWEVTFLNVEPGEYSFKVIQGDSWDYSWGWEANGEPVSFSTDELTNIRVIFGYKDDELGVLRVEYLYNRLGDFNGDGLTDNIGGVARLFAHVRGKTLLAEDLLPKADTNQDGKINIADVARMFKAVRTGENLPTIPTTE